ncbi:GNAT superfamily N-acetyltransferase [Dyadobacter sp. BE34]|uniref:GNAT superfamily N-acetyltransferase n=1 Tax=Dyadobacter fermentans TaxID=94254 RepID=A0ABU1QT05_9BACT|nr:MULTISPECIES: GNAT family N-acetyltransferase [Dyadobacter]MDR6804288.1 GNAT superfamily N-acetyltransferase [Dyadobacter fermentans]MDR7042028.1 GNAT superfamily N-acetyltransferase [Dyadobacter sp. BE242]MDR7196431.1 GNAT superfamily N-acetyltransferase [Dyadobacter sp. BE34]MDR7213024.1 GNAT superfamily N-acetyltransferase [Dyadobacter sp. BE31]MDR7261837.1 GNAT superfamily N-acetyltransferase [Dyadobacter sp. BE32]
MDSIEIQKVSADDLMEIRHLVLWPDKPREFVKVPEDESGIHFGLYFEGALVSVISLFADAQDIRFRKFATLPALQGKGLGSRLLQHAIAYAQTQGYTRMWCDARADALGFYKRFGFKKFSKSFFKEHIEYYKIERML